MYKKILALLISISIFILFLDPATAKGFGDNPPNSPTAPVIDSIAVSNNSHTAGSMQSITISVATRNILNATAISAQLTDSAGVNPVDGVDTASSSINNNTAVLSLLIPAGTAAGSYRIKVNIASLNISDISMSYTILAGPKTSITAVEQEPANHTAGNAQLVAVKVTTNNASNGTAVTVQLLDSNDGIVANVNAASGTINNNYASVSLNIPGTIGAGIYKIRTTVLTASYDVPYSINSQSSKPTISRVRLSSYSQTQGTAGNINVTVDTANASNNASVSVDLVDASNTNNIVAGVTAGTGNINGNSTTIPLTIPASVLPGSYKVRVTVDGVQNPDTSQNYSVVLPELTITNISTLGASLAQGFISGNLTISGTNFSATASQNTVLIVDTNGVLVKPAAEPSGANSSSLTVAIPTDLLQGTYKVKVSVGGQSKVSTKTFTVTAPLPAIAEVVSDGANLVEGSISGTLTVNGVNFGINPTDNSLVLVKGSTETLCMISSSTAVQLKAAIPVSLTEGSYSVKVSVGGASATHSGFNVTKPDIPAAPGNLSASATSADSITIGWNSAAKVTGYHVYRSVNNTDYTRITSNPINAAGYTDSGLTAGTAYYYKITAVNVAGESPKSNELVVITVPGAPLAPITGTIGSNSIQLSWTATAGAAGYNVYRSTNGTDYSKINGSGAVNNNTYTDSALTSGTSYCYKVTAVNASGESNKSSVLNAVTLTEAPLVPKAGSVTTNSIAIDWTSVPRAIGYCVYRSASLTGTYSLIGNTSANVLTFRDTGLNQGTAYYYKITAKNSSGAESGYSPALSTSTMAGAATGSPDITPVPQTPDADGENNNSDSSSPAEAQETDNTKGEEPVLEGLTVKVEFTAESLTEEFSNAQTDKNGVKTVVRQIEEIDGAKEYAIQIPAELFSKTDLSQQIMISTPLAAITVPDNMFSDIKDADASNIELSISIADTSKLPANVRKAIGDRPILEFSAAVNGEAIAWNNPNAPVTISIDYKPTAKELKNPEYIVVCYIDGKGKIVTVPNGRYDIATGKVTFTTTHFSQYAVNYVFKTFKDISKSSARKKIEVLYSKGIISGTSINNYSPKENITRGDFVLYLVNALGLTAEIESNYDDVKKTDPYYTAIGIAKELGITSSVGKNKFNPKETITREEAAVIIVNAMKAAKIISQKADLKYLKKYNDYNKIASNAKISFSILVKEGILVGKGKTLNPKGLLTREQTAIILYRLYNMKYN